MEFFRLSLSMTALLLLSSLNLGQATEYFVSGIDGYDYNPGTIDRPWQHIWRAALALHPGDICTIRGGQYFEEITLSGKQGTRDQPITFRAYPGEKVVLRGTFGPISGPWFSYTDKIYRTPLGYDIWQLFVDDEMQVNARWPNAYWYDYSIFNYTRWGFSDDSSTYDKDSGTGVMVDNGAQNLAKSGLNVTGAIAVLNIGSFLTWAGLVEKHAPGENSFTYNLQQVPSSVSYKASNSRYFLEDKLEFLDSPSEWFYDKTTKDLYLWTKSSDHPLNHDIQGKRITFAFTITKGSSWIVLSGLNFFATTVYIGGANADEDVHNIRLESLHFTYPSYSKRMLGSLAVPDTTTIYYNGPLTKHAGNFSVFNCTWEYADGQTMQYRGADGVFENSLWHHNDFSCVGNGDLFKSEGARDLFIRNTVHSNGPSVGFSPGAGKPADMKLGLPTGGVVRLNHFYDLKYLQDDGAEVQTRAPSQNGTILENNWCYDTMKWGLRFDRGTAVNATWGYNGTMRYNVVWKTRGLSVKGDAHQVHHNLGFDGQSSIYDLVLFGHPGSGRKKENEHTLTTRNILQNGACNTNKASKCAYIPGNFTNNVIEDVRKLLRDPDNLDFRPKRGSDLITKDIGPYGQESMAFGGYYWIPGRQQLVAGMPIPPDGTTTAKCDADLMWLAGYGAESHDVYFGTDKTGIASANSTSHESAKYFYGQLKLPTNVVEAGIFKFNPGTTYYWRVDARVPTKDSINVGPVWQFECKE